MLLYLETARSDTQSAPGVGYRVVDSYNLCNRSQTKVVIKVYFLNAFEPIGCVVTR